MRLGLAAKLCLLAATLVFCATGAAGALFFKGARDVVRHVVDVHQMMLRPL